MSSSALPLRVPTCNTAPSVPMPPLHAPPGTARAVRPGPKAPSNPSALPGAPASASCRTASSALAVASGRWVLPCSGNDPATHPGVCAAAAAAHRAAHPTRNPEEDPKICEKPRSLPAAACAACAADLCGRNDYFTLGAADAADALPGLGRRRERRRSRLRSHRRRSRRPGRAATATGDAGTTPNENLLETTEGQIEIGLCGPRRSSWSPPRRLPRHPRPPPAPHRAPPRAAGTAPTGRHERG